MAKIINLPQTTYQLKEKALIQAVAIEYFINENGCHICVSHALDKDGYPRVHRFGKDRRMSRYVWQITNGCEIPKGMLIMHTCDNPNCVNPDHLKLGTHKDNMADRSMKGRTSKGSKHPNAKLTENDVYFIKFESNDITPKILSEMFGVTKDTICEIRRGKSWKHVTEDSILQSVDKDAA